MPVKCLQGLGTATIHRRVKQSNFPAPCRLSERCVRWREPEIVAWIDSSQDFIAAT